MYTLVILFMVGNFGSTNGVAVGSVSGFETKELCELARKDVEAMKVEGDKPISTMCIKVRNF